MDDLLPAPACARLQRSSNIAALILFRVSSRCDSDEAGAHALLCG